ncbi:tyrosine-type recombinase/integrase [Mycobacteroides abscessus]|uniref:tyrosine-type recombinase/integrase n=1 Tax=Mycobacteroides abscessus TaxID=36809 RepID=UPI0019D181ED|nr:site-specific integrase [Mycobacteroides abscessus]MBN7314774.1 tyrosine-type recombinase/integrase [Mycobacteroides abscessus subsp. abscessus]
MAGRPPLDIGTHGDIGDPTLLPSGSYQVVVRHRDADGQTRKVTATGKTEAQAKAALRKKLKDRTAVQGGGGLTPESALSALVEKWLETLEPKRRSKTGVREGSLTDGTIKRYTEVCRDIIIPSIGALRIREVTTQRVDAYLATRQTRKREVRGRLSQVCGLGVRWNLLEYNPVRETETVPPSKSDKRTLTPEDVRELMRRTVEWQQRKPGKGGPQRGVDMVQIVALLMASQERINEVLALRWEDIEFLDDKTKKVKITIAGTINDDGIREQFPKTDAGYRTVTLPEYGREALLQQREKGVPFDLVFPSRNGTPRGRRNVANHWRQIRGEDYEWVISRTFRKTGGTAVERKHGAEAAARHLGHSSPDITRRHYIDRAIEAGDFTDALDEFDPFTSNKRPRPPHLKVVGED